MKKHGWEGLRGKGRELSYFDGRRLALAVPQSPLARSFRVIVRALCSVGSAVQAGHWQWALAHLLTLWDKIQ